MTKIVSIEGRIVPADRASVSVFDRGFLYGDSVFETIRTYAGRPYKLSEHLERLSTSAAAVFIELPITLEQFKTEIEEAVARAGNPESYIRVMVTRGSGELGLDPGLSQSPLRVVLVAELHTPEQEQYENGVCVITHRAARLADFTQAVGAKIGNYLVAVLAMREARARGAVEALILDTADRIVEGSTSNVFFVKEGRLITPPEASGILAGITRATILELAERTGIETEFRALSVSELEQLDELFISSSIRELLPVVQVDGERIAAGRPGPLTRRLLADYRASVAAQSGLTPS